MLETIIGLIIDNLLLVIIAVVLFFVIVTLLKSVIKAGIILFLIIFLFRVGFIYTSDDLKEKINLDRFIKEEYQESFFDKFDDFRDRTKQNNVIDQEEINSLIEREIEEKVNDLINKNKP